MYASLYRFFLFYLIQKLLFIHLLFTLYSSLGGVLSICPTMSDCPTVAQNNIYQPAGTGGLSGWDLNVLPVSVRVYSMCSGFLP